MCRLLQINKTRTTGYHPRSDGLVELLNRIIKDILSKYISAKQTDWDKYIDGLVLSYNTTPHETNNITPYRMVFGTEARIPVDIMSDRIEQEEVFDTENESEYARHLEEELAILYEIAREVTGKIAIRQKKKYMTVMSDKIISTLAIWFMEINHI